MTIEEYIKEQRERVNNMTLAQARQIVADRYGHDDMRIECEKAVWMLLKCADEKINNGWIPITERLPEVEEEATRCLVTIDGFGTIDDYTAIRTYFSDTKDFNDVVTAWMPLPKPYKAESE